MTQISSPTIVIIDDAAAVREAAGSLLRSAGWRVAAFASAEDFLGSARAGSVDCLILDIDLPGMNGLQLQRFLGSSGWHAPVVFITAAEDRDGRIRTQAMQQGAHCLLFKPFLDDDLLGAIRSALQG